MADLWRAKSFSYLGKLDSVRRGGKKRLSEKSTSDVTHNIQLKLCLLRSEGNTSLTVNVRENQATWNMPMIDHAWKVTFSDFVKFYTCWFLIETIHFTMLIRPNKHIFYPICLVSLLITSFQKWAPIVSLRSWPKIQVSILFVFFFKHLQLDQSAFFVS